MEPLIEDIEYYSNNTGVIEGVRYWYKIEETVRCDQKLSAYI